MLHVNGFISWIKADVNTAHFVHGGWFKSPYYPFGPTKGLWSAYQYVYTRVNTTLERWAYRRSRAITAVSQKVADEIAGRHRQPQDQRDLQRRRRRRVAGAQADRAAFKLPDDAFLLLFVGDLRTPRKNLGTVLKALTKLPANDAWRWRATCPAARIRKRRARSASIRACISSASLKTCRR